MPDLVVIVGPPAVGKATVGREVAFATGYRFFHNHLTAEPSAALFGWGTPAALEANEAVRLLLLGRALADRAIPGVVFTFVWAFGLAADDAFIARLEALCATHGARAVYVELHAALATRLAREGAPDRVAMKPVKADVAAARAVQRDFDARFRMRSDGRFPYPERHLVVDTETATPAEAARRIVERFDLPRAG